MTVATLLENTLEAAELHDPSSAYHEPEPA